MYGQIARRQPYDAECPRAGQQLLELAQTVSSRGRPSRFCEPHSCSRGGQTTVRLHSAEHPSLRCKRSKPATKATSNSQPPDNGSHPRLADRPRRRRNAPHRGRLRLETADRATLTKPLALVAADADCTLAITGAHVVSSSIVSNARSVEVSAGPAPATTQYKGTVRGDQQKQPHRFRAELKALDAPFVTLKLLSRKGDARTLSIDSLEIVVDAAAPEAAAAASSGARRGHRKPASASSSHQKTLLAGAALLDAAERRLTAHVDAACARVQRHLGAKLDAQGAALIAARGRRGAARDGACRRPV